MPSPDHLHVAPASASSRWPLSRPVRCLSPRIVKALELNGARCVLAVGNGPGKSIARLRYSQESVGEAAATYLTERGRKRLLVVMPDDPRLADIGAERSRRDPPGARTGGACVCSRCRWTSTRHETASSTQFARNPSRRRRVRLQRRVRVDRAAGAARCGHRGTGRHRRDGLRQPSLRRTDAAISDHDRRRRHRRPDRRLSSSPCSRVVRGRPGRWACRPSSLENRLSTEDALAS